jgi:hypothetical protein
VPQTALVSLTSVQSTAANVSKSRDPSLLVLTSAPGYCGNSFSAGSVAAAAGDCSFPCAGNAAEICGAGNRLSVYTTGGGTGTTTVGGGGGGTTTTPPVQTTQPAGPGPQIAGLPAGWVYSGCLQ